VSGRASHHFPSNGSDRRHAARRRLFPRAAACLGLLALVNSCQGVPALSSAALSESTAPPAMAESELKKIGQRIWQNECGGTVEGLTSWNAGENFASLGIGHCIWYPQGVDGPYEESFPGLVAFLKSSGATLPRWLASAKDCPWQDRRSFLEAKDSAQMKELRQLLAATIAQQTEFLSQRFLRGTKKIIDAAPAADRSTVQSRISTLYQSAAGRYAMIDYVNFKGEGTNPKERYQDHGWGLLQVLLEMKGRPAAGTAAAEFSQAAQRVLERRISLAPRNESMWRAGWMNRCKGYARAF
jgi:hypothetical protein